MLLFKNGLEFEFTLGQDVHPHLSQSLPFSVLTWLSFLVKQQYESLFFITWTWPDSEASVPGRTL